ncbi:MAG: CsbD family protein [Actinomycetota bacterium]
MSLWDKLTGRAKKAAGDIADDPSLRREGAREEQKGERKEELSHAQESVENKAKEVGDLERKT